MKNISTPACLFTVLGVGVSLASACAVSEAVTPVNADTGTNTPDTGPEIQDTGEKCNDPRGNRNEGLR